MKKWNIKNFFLKSWRWSLVLTLPVSIGFFSWFFNTLDSYYTFRLKFNPFTSISLWNRGVQEAYYLTNGLKDLFYTRTPDGKGLDAIQLFIDESKLKKLNSDLPYSGREYVKAKLLYPDTNYYDVKLKYRGDFTYHWMGRKKSLRIKTKKKQLYKSMRMFNLIVPKTKYILNNHLSYILAKKMKLLSPESKFVEVYINGKYIGVQLMVEQLKEQFLRRNGRLPGDLFVGEMVGRDEYPGVLQEIFSNPEFWTKASINNHNPPEWSKSLIYLCSLISKGEQEKILDIIDFESWKRFLAFITISQSLHYDSTHNWRLYFDPARGKFEPIVWDPLGWNFGDFSVFISKLKNPMDIITNAIFDKLHKSHRFLTAKHSAIESFFLTGGDQFLLKAIEDTSRLKVSLRGDRNLIVESIYNYYPNQIIEEIEVFKEKVKESLQKIKTKYLETPPSAFYSIDKKSGMVQINVEGFTPIKFLEINYESPVLKTNKIGLYFRKNGKLISKEITRYLNKEKRTIRLDIPLLARRKMVDPPGNVGSILKDVLIEPASYLLDIKGLNNLSIRRIRAGYSQNKLVTLEQKEKLDIYPLDGNHDIVPIEKEKKEFIWKGKVIINNIMEIEDNLTIKPGTEIRFTPGSALVIRGKLYARGTKENPIKFIPAKENQDPWGAVILAGNGADGSLLSHCYFSNGSGIRHKMVEYSAMFSVHDVKDVMVENCSFSDSRVVDDMVHAVYSEITFKNCEFENAFSDALDLDYVKGRVENSHFINSGNDALDLMSSQVAVISSEMRRSGDKGISAGEGSDIFVWNSTLLNNMIGIQVKDRSNAVLYNTELLQNNKSIDAYQKNWQYGDGGHVQIYKSRLIGSSPIITADKQSRIKVYDSFLDGKTGKSGKKKKRIILDASVDSDSKFNKKARSDKRFSEGLKLHEYLKPYRKLIDPTVRGTISDAT